MGHAADILDLSQLTRWLTVGLAFVGIAICAIIGLARTETLRDPRTMRLLHIALPTVAFYKLLAFAGFFVIPLVATTAASYHVFEATKEVAACARCHVMWPMVNDMRDPGSELLAAKHFKNRWINEEQCYHCHADYGLYGTVEAKLDGLRHLLRYTSRTYTEPIALRHAFDNANCMPCHAGTPKYVAADMHETMRDEIASNSMTCTSCHGDAHPTREQRTPDSADYAHLMSEPK